MDNNTNQQELRKRIGEMKPHTETQLPLNKILSYLELNALIDVVNKEVTSVLNSLEDDIAHTIMITDTQGNETIPDGQYIKVPNMLKAIQSIKEKYNV